MANILQYNPASVTVANRVVSFRTSQDTGLWVGVPNTLINPVMPLGVAINDLKVAAGLVVELTAQEKADIAAAQAAAGIVSSKDGAKTMFDDAFPNGRVLRAVAEALLDQLNTLRQNPTATLPVITVAQARTAIRNKIDAQS